MEILRNDYNQDILHAHTHTKKKDLEFLFFLLFIIFPLYSKI